MLQVEVLSYFWNSVILLGFVMIVVYYLIRISKGSIIITLPSLNYSYGEEINGEVKIIAHRRIKVKKILVSVVCKEIKMVFLFDPMLWWKEVYSRSQRVSGVDTLERSSERTYKFQIINPSLGNNVRQVYNTTPPRVFRRSFANLPRKWFVEVWVDAYGVDLRKRQSVNMVEGLRSNNQLYK
jgi:hypothetical protein